MSDGIGKARRQMEMAVGKLEESRLLAEAGQGPMNDAAAALLEQNHTKLEAIDIGVRVAENLKTLQLSLGALGGALIDGKLASQTMNDKGTTATKTFSGAYEHAVTARNLVTDATDETVNEVTPVFPTLTETIAQARWLTVRGERSQNDFDIAIESSRAMMQMVDLIAVSLSELLHNIPGLGRDGGSPEVHNSHISEAPEAAERAIPTINESIRSIQERIRDW